jgi:hypothetical protein
MLVSAPQVSVSIQGTRLNLLKQRCVIAPGETQATFKDLCLVTTDRIPRVEGVVGELTSIHNNPTDDVTQPHDTLQMLSEYLWQEF